VIVMASNSKDVIPREFQFAGSRGRPTKGTHASSGLYVRAPSGLRLRDRKVGRLLTKLKDACPWLQPSDEPTARAWCEIEVLGMMAHAILRKAGIINSSGETRRLFTDYLRLRSIQLQYSNALGLSPAARAAIGANNHRQPLDLVAAMAQGNADEDAEVVPPEGES
jgi:hypothetical protein